MKKTKKIKLLVIVMLVLLFLSFGLSFAYFTARINQEKNINTNIITATTDQLEFIAGDPITFDANLENFKQGGEDLVSISKPKVRLTANNATNYAKKYYDVYFAIYENNFSTTNNQTVKALENNKSTDYRVERIPNNFNTNKIIKISQSKYNAENLVLKVTDPKGNNVDFAKVMDFTYNSDIPKRFNYDWEMIKKVYYPRKYNTARQNHYFDLTQSFDYMFIAENYEIESNNIEEHEWTFEVRFLNLDHSQNENQGKKFIAKIFFMSSKPIIENVKITRNSDKIEFTLDVKSNDSKSYSYAITDPDVFASDTDFINTENNKITITNLDPNKKYKLNLKIGDDFYYSEIIDSISLASACINQKMGECISQNYQNDTSILYHNSSLVNGANDNSYRYVGSNPNNYVCFKDKCNKNELYRILGVFDNKIKIIKDIEMGAYFYQDFDKPLTNFINAEINSVILNGSYLDGLDFKDKIINNNWKVIECTSNYCTNGTPKTIYDEETNINNKVEVFNGKIGLPYLNDYSYTITNDKWDKSINNIGSRATTWINNNTRMLFFLSYGQLKRYYLSDRNDMHNKSNHNDKYNIKPTFYLNSDVVLVSGSGTEMNPYVLN